MGVLKGTKTAKDFEDIKDFLRPNLLVFTKCKNVLLGGVTFQNSPAWNLHPLMCENLAVRNIYAKNPWYAQNGGGIDIEGCKNVLGENSTFDVGDDGICIKSGKGEEGRKRGMPTENVTARNCVVYHAHGGFLIGKGKTVTLDHYFNSEVKKDITGVERPFHYVWEEMDNNGFSLLGNVFNSYCVKTETLFTAPTTTNLKKSDIYIIVDADNFSDNPKMNLVTEKDAANVYDWVKAGGVLILLHNDKPNAEFEHFKTNTSKC